ncbi:MAG: mechanosensitive ion channel family protein [Candidatus Merdivicinus sp.]|jgi:MscS family membrane protein
MQITELLKEWGYSIGIAIFDGIIPLLLSIGIFLALFLLRKKITSFLLRLTGKAVERFPLATDFVRSFERPLPPLIACFGAYWAALIFAHEFFPNAAAFPPFLGTCIRIAVIVALTWGLFRAANPISSAILGDKPDLNKTLLLFLTRIVQGILLIVATVIIIRETGYDITGLITGIGLGGLTFALAAQDSASNLFGGMVIILDKPFAVDDWIQTPDLEGTVTDITLRSTRIRTFKDAEIIIPNSTLANVPIINWSRMSKRRVHFTVGLTYQTPQDKLEQAVQVIRDILASNPEQIVSDSSLVTFDQFGAYSLDIAVYYFTVVTSWRDYMKTKEWVNFEIRRRLTELGVEFAYPTQTIFQEKSEAASPADLNP